MQCPRCQHENPTGHKFCRECGTPLSRPTMSGSPGPSYADLERALSEALEQQTATAECGLAGDETRKEYEGACLRVAV
jgi:hypothetical protein